MYCVIFEKGRSKFRVKRTFVIEVKVFFRGQCAETLEEFRKIHTSTIDPRSIEIGDLDRKSVV